MCRRQALGYLISGIDLLIMNIGVQIPKTLTAHLDQIFAVAAEHQQQVDYEETRSFELWGLGWCGKKRVNIDRDRNMMPSPSSANIFP